MQIEPVQGFCPAQRVDGELRQLVVAQVQGPQGRSNGPVKEYLCYFIFKIYVSMCIQYQQNQGSIQNSYTVFEFDWCHCKILHCNNKKSIAMILARECPEFNSCRLLLTKLKIIHFSS